MTEPTTIINSTAYLIISPPRPGLIKISGGSSIELEIWAMPKSNFGAFMGGIPHPLGIGTISCASRYRPGFYL